MYWQTSAYCSTGRKRNGRNINAATMGRTEQNKFPKWRWIRKVARRSSSLRPCRRDALDKRLLGEEKQQDRGQDDQGAGGHEQVPGGAAGFALEILQAEREGELFGALQVNQWTEEIVPDAHERKERNDREGGFCERQNDPPEDAQFAASVDAGGFGKFGRDGHEELAE